MRLFFQRVPKVLVTFHVEALHKDKVWYFVQKFAKFCFRHGIRVIWFSINPTWKGYTKINFDPSSSDEKKWKERLKYLSNLGQEVQLHTHFYTKDGIYNLSLPFVKKRLEDDKNWLESQGYSISHFISGAWKINEDIITVLNQMKFTHDYSINICRQLNDTYNYKNLVSIPSTCTPAGFFKRGFFLKKCKNLTFYLHDYDLGSVLMRLAFYFFVFFFYPTKLSEQKFLNNEIYIHPHDHKKKRDWSHILAFIGKILPNVNSVLDIAAGTGNFLNFCAENGKKVSGTEYEKNLLDTIKKRVPSADILFHDINTDFPYNNSTFDLVSCIGTLHYSYVKDIEVILERMKRVSNRYLFVDFFPVYSYYVLWEKLRNPKYNPRRYHKKDIEILAEKYNLKIVNAFGSKLCWPFSQYFPFLGKAVYVLFEKKD